MIRLIAILLALYAAPVAASCITQPKAAGVHIVSTHDLPGFRNINPGLYAVNQCGMVGGVYRNSVGKVTAYAGYMLDPDSLPVWASFSAATGYRSETGWRISPLVAIGLKSSEFGGGYRFRVAWVPRVMPINRVNVIHLLLECRF